MSIETENTELECDINQGCDAIELIIQPRETDLGEFKVKRTLPTRQRKMVGPWIFFDHIGPADFAPGSGINVRPHPHINLATVTYLLEGEILHRDSLGSYQTITPGDINLMVAGRGIAHSERERPEVRSRAHRLHGFQLWLALPVKDEEIAPAFYHYPERDIPAKTVDVVCLIQWSMLVGSPLNPIQSIRTPIILIYKTPLRTLPSSSYHSHSSQDQFKLDANKQSQTRKRASPSGNIGVSN